jgi:hypothetical protein
MEISSPTRPASPPPAPARPPEKNRSQDYAAEQRQAAARAQQTENKKPQPVVNTQGQTTGRIVNTRA